MADARLEQLANFVTRMAHGEAVDSLELPGDDTLSKIAADLGRIAHSHGGPNNGALFSHGPVVLFRWHNQAGWPVEYVSDNVEILTGYPAEEFASGQRPYISLIIPDDVERVSREVADNSANAEWFEHRPYRLRRRDGQILWVYDYTVVLRNADGAVTHFYGYIMDITERIASDALIREQVALIHNFNAPILQVWDGVLAVPLLGLLSDERATRVTEALLARISAGQINCVILDFTGVELIDTSTAHHLGRMARALALLGSKCLLSGMSPMIARTVVTLGIDFQGVQIFPTLAAALGQVLEGIVDDGPRRAGLPNR